MTYVIIGLIALGLVMLLFKERLNPPAQKIASSQDVKITELSAPQIAEEDEDEIMAVIAAAIQAYGSNLKIKAITRVPGSQGSAWAQMGRIDAMNQRKL